jgi:hypothetical protein
MAPEQVCCDPDEGSLIEDDRANRSTMLCAGLPGRLATPVRDDDAEDKAVALVAKLGETVIRDDRSWRTGCSRAVAFPPGTRICRDMETNWIDPAEEVPPTLKEVEAQTAQRHSSRSLPRWWSVD